MGHCKTQEDTSLPGFTGSTAVLLAKQQWPGIRPAQEGRIKQCILQGMVPPFANLNAKLIPKLMTANFNLTLKL